MPKRKQRGTYAGSTINIGGSDTQIIGRIELNRHLTVQSNASLQEKEDTMKQVGKSSKKNLGSATKIGDAIRKLSAERRYTQAVWPLFSLQLQSGPAFRKKSISIQGEELGDTVYIPISKAKMREILAAFPDIAQEG